MSVEISIIFCAGLSALWHAPEHLILYIHNYIYINTGKAQVIQISTHLQYNIYSQSVYTRWGLFEELATFCIFMQDLMLDKYYMFFYLVVCAHAICICNFMLVFYVNFCFSFRYILFWKIATSFLYITKIVVYVYS